MATPPSILDLHAKLRSQLGLDATPQVPVDFAHAFAAATNAIAGASQKLEAPLQLAMFLVGLVSINGDLRNHIRDLSLDTLTRLRDINGKVTHAWANILCLDSAQITVETLLSAVKNLVSAASPGGKSPSIVEHDTPIHVNSALPYSTQANIRAHVNPFLRAELRDTVLKDVGGFYYFFPGITQGQWDCAVNCPASCACPSDVAFPTPRSSAPHPILRFPSDASEGSVLQWFTSFNKPHSPRTFYASPSRPLMGSLSDSVRKCGLFLAPTSTTIEALTTTLAAAHPWASVLIPVELKAPRTKDANGDTIIQLATYVREIFGAQLTRRFVHAFTICGTILRCYLFDRAGVSISEMIDIRKNNRTEELFIRILESYVSMDPAQLGFDQNYEYIATNNTISSMPSLEAPMPQFFNFCGERFKLRESVFHRPVIVSRGTTCWGAENLRTGKSCIIKDSWRARWRTSEGDLLTLAEKKGVFALPAPILHGDVLVQCREQKVVDTIEQVREWLNYNDAVQVLIKLKLEDDLYSLHSSLPVVPVSMGFSHKQSSVALGRKPLSDITKERTRKRTFHPTLTEEQGIEVQHNKIRKMGHSTNSHVLSPAGKKIVALKSSGSKKSRSATSVPSLRQHTTTLTTRRMDHNINKAPTNKKGIEKLHAPTPAPSNTQPTTTLTTHRMDTNISWPLPNKQDSGSLSREPISDPESLDYDWTLTLPQCGTPTALNQRQEVHLTDQSSVVHPLGTQRMFMDMTHSVIVSNAVGEEIQSFQCVKDLLKGMRDAIKCKPVTWPRKELIFEL